MTLTISPEVEEQITKLARARGITADEFASELLERSMANVAEPSEAHAGPPVEPTPMSAQDFLRRGPLQPDIATGWPRRSQSPGGRPASANAIYPATRPTANQLLTELHALAGSDRPAKEYPEDFFSREVIYADHD